MRRLDRTAIAIVLVAGCGRYAFRTIDDDGGADGMGSGDGAGLDAHVCSVRLGAGRQHFTAIFDDATVRVWGSNDFGQIDASMMNRPSPTTIAMPAPVVSASGGRFETCVALATGQARCWGEGTSGQLGDGLASTTPTPVIVANLTNVVEVAAAAIHSCARIGNGEVYCWGDGSSGRLGTGMVASSNVPVATINISTAKRLVAGGSTSCAILADDTARCWGYNVAGGCGVNSTADQLSPVEPIGLGTVRSISPRDLTTCAVRADGAVFCFGSNAAGQAGRDSGGADLLVPTPVVVQGGAQLVGADENGQGILHGCARLGTEIWCWGDNTLGQLGNGMIDAGHPYAAPVSGLPPVYQLAVGAYTTCAVDAGAGVWCWGGGSAGELGDGAFAATRPTPMRSFGACP